MTYPPPPPGHPGGHPQDPYGLQPQQPDPYGQQPQFPPANDPYAPQPDPYGQAPVSGTPDGGGWGSPPQSAPAGGYPPNPMDPMGGQPGMPGQPGGMPGQPPMGQPPMFGMPPQPPKKSNTGIIVGAVIGVVALLGLATVLVFTLGGDDDKVTTEPSSDTTSADPSDEPSDDPTSEDPVEETVDVSYFDFATSWTGSYGGDSLSAEYYTGWDYPTCADVANSSVLETEGCQYGVEVVHEIDNGDDEMRVSQMLLVFDESASTFSLATDLNKAEFEADYRFQSDSFVPGYAGGLWLVDSTGPFVVITVVSWLVDSDEELAESYLYGKTDDTKAYLQIL